MTMNTEPEGRENAVLTVALVLATVLSIGMIVLMLLGVVRASAEPQRRSFFNDKGQEVGRSTTRGNTTTIQDYMGREVGRTERRPDGTTNFYDSAGRIIGTSRAGSAR
jgi:hypothetical protein